jgi:Glyoxalase-like domain
VPLPGLTQLSVRSVISRLKDVCIDCVDPWPLAHWWAEVLGYRVRPHSPEDLAALRDRGIDRPEDDPAIALDPVDKPGPSFWFNRVPKPKTAKNRVHVDVYGDADDLRRRGATLVQRLDRWTVMADPEGNEFCVFAS